jgi:hypothetical protein
MRGTGGLDQLLTSPSLVASPNHLGIEVNLREADSGFNAARRRLAVRDHR